MPELNEREHLIHVLESEKIAGDRCIAGKLQIKGILDNLDLDAAARIGCGVAEGRPSKDFAKALECTPMAVSLVFSIYGTKLMYQTACVAKAMKTNEIQEVLGCFKAFGKLEFRRDIRWQLSDEDIQRLLLSDATDAVLSMLRVQHWTAEAHDGGDPQRSTVFTRPWNIERICGIARAVCDVLGPEYDPKVAGRVGLEAHANGQSDRRSDFVG